MLLKSGSRSAARSETGEDYTSAQGNALIKIVVLAPLLVSTTFSGKSSAEADEAVNVLSTGSNFNQSGKALPSAELAVAAVVFARIEVGSAKAKPALDDKASFGTNTSTSPSSEAEGARST